MSPLLVVLKSPAQASLQNLEYYVCQKLQSGGLKTQSGLHVCAIGPHSAFPLIKLVSTIQNSKKFT